jgi:prepilin-type processing-associated H-X9-DG protein
MNNSSSASGQVKAKGGNLIAGRNYDRAVKMSDLSTPGPANVFTFVDESTTSALPGSDASGGSGGVWFGLTPGIPQGSEFMDSLPGWYHGKTVSNLAFADGHVESHKWLNKLSIQPMGPSVKKSQLLGYNSGHITVKNSADYEYLEDHTLWHPISGLP